MFIHPDYFPLYDYRNINFTTLLIENRIISQPNYLYIEVYEDEF